MIIDGTYASPLFTDLSIDPSDRKVVDNLANRNSMSGGLARVMTAVLKDDTELFKQFMDNESFRRWLTDTVFGLTYQAPPSS